MSRASHINKHNVHDLQKHIPSSGRHSKSYGKGQVYIILLMERSWEQYTTYKNFITVATCLYVFGLSLLINCR